VPILERKINAARSIKRANAVKVVPKAKALPTWINEPIWQKSTQIPKNYQKFHPLLILLIAIGIP
jgi:hypothetical protein